MTKTKSPLKHKVENTGPISHEAHKELHGFEGDVDAFIEQHDDDHDEVDVKNYDKTSTQEKLSESEIAESDELMNKLDLSSFGPPAGWRYQAGPTGGGAYFGPNGESVPVSHADAETDLYGNAFPWETVESESDELDLEEVNELIENYNSNLYNLKEYEYQKVDNTVGASGGGWGGGSAVLDQFHAMEVEQGMEAELNVFKNELVEKYGTDDPATILAEELGDNAFATQAWGDAVGWGKFLRGVEMPDFGSIANNKYIYGAYMEDYGTDADEKAVMVFDWVFGSDFQGAAENESFEDPNHGKFKYRFFSEYVDRSQIKNINNSRKAVKIEEENLVKNGMAVELENIQEVASTYYTGTHKETYDLFESGDFEGGVAKNEELGYVTLYNKNGKWINWEDVPEEEVNLDNWKDAIGDNGETFTSKEEYAEYIQSKIGTISAEDEENARILALDNKPDMLQLQRKAAAYEVVAAVQQLMSEDPELVMFDSETLLGELYDVVMAIGKEDLEANLNKIIETGQIQPGLRKFTADNQNYETYNNALGKFKSLSRALDLNQDPTLLPEGNFFTERWTTDFTGMTADEEVDWNVQNFGDILNIQKTEKGLGIKRDGSEYASLGTWFGHEVDLRDVLEGGRDFVVDIAPLVASVIITKKLTGAQITAFGNAFRNILQMGSKSKTWNFVSSLFVAGTEELVVLAGADQVGGLLFDMDPMVYNPGKGGLEESFNWQFAFGLGVGNELSKKIIQKLYTTKYGISLMEKVEKIKTLDKVFSAHLGAVSGVGSMEIAKVFSGDSWLQVDFSKWEEEGFSSEQEYRDEVYYESAKHMVSDYIGMLTLNLLGPNSGTMKAVAKDIENMKINVFKVSKASKILGIKESPRKVADPNEIDNAGAKKETEARDRYQKEYKKIEEDLNEAKEKTKNKEELNKKDKKALKKEKQLKEKLDLELKEIKTSVADMQFRNDLVKAKELIAKDKKKQKETDKLTFRLQKKIQMGKELNGKDVVDFANMTDTQFEYYIAKLQVEFGQSYPKLRETMESQREFYKSVVENVKSHKILFKTEKEQHKFIEQTVELLKKKSELDRLKKNNKKGENDTRIKILEKEINGSKEVKNKEGKVIEKATEGLDKKHLEVVESLEAAFKKRVTEELIIAESIAKDLGAEFEIAKETKNKKGEVIETVEQVYERLAGKGSEGTAGVHIRGKKGQPDRIIVNPETAAKALTLGTGIHEVVHYILRDVLKEKRADGKYVVTKEGRVIIDKFLKNLEKSNPNARKVLEDRIKKNYATKTSQRLIDPKTGKPIEIKVPKEEYYEEYLTSYVEALKNKEIKLDRSTAQKIQNTFMPYINKVFPNIGKGKEYSVEDATSLQNMLESLYDASNRGVSKWQMKDFMKRNPELAAGAYSSFSKVPISAEVKAKMDKINEAAEGNYKELLNKKIEGTDKNKYTKKEVGEIWNKEWKGPDSNPMEGRWFDTYLEKADNIFDVMLKKTSEFNRKSGGKILDERAFASQVVQELAGLNANQIKQGGHMRNFDITEISKYKKEGKYPGFSGWVNTFGNQKLLNVFRNAKDLVRDKKETSLSEEGVERKMDLDAFEMIQAETSREINDRIQLESEKLKLHEAFGEVNTGKGNQVKEIYDAIQNQFKNKDGSTNIEKLKKATEGKNYKTLEVAMLAETVKIFTGGRTYKKGQNKGKFIHEVLAEKIKKGANIDKQDIEAVQPMLDKFIPTMFGHVLPEGFITKPVDYRDVDKLGQPITKTTQVPAESAGVPREIQKVAYTKQEKAGTLVTTGKDKLRTIRSKENFFAHRKKSESSKVISDLRESVGIMSNGTFKTNPRNVYEINGKVYTSKKSFEAAGGKEKDIKKGVGEETKGLLYLTSKILTSQPIRELLDAEGRVFESTMLKLADGKPHKAFSNVTEIKGFREKMTEAIIDISSTEAQRISDIIRRQQTGEFYDFKMIDDVFGKENPAIREILENGLVEAQGLELITKVTKLQSIKDFYETPKESERFEKEEAKSAKQLAEKYNVNSENVSLANVNNSLDLIQKRKDNNVLVLNNMPVHYKHIPKNALAALLTTFGWNSRARREIINEGKSINKTIISKDARENSVASLDSYFGKERIIDKGNVYDGRYDKCFVPGNFGTLKRQINTEAKRLKKLVDRGKLKQSEADMMLVDFVRGKFSYNQKSSGYEATVKANETLAKDFLTARKKAFDIETRDLGEQIALENVMVHNAMQSEHSTGIEKAMNYNLEHIAWEGSKPGTYTFENKKGTLKEYKTKDELHWEHERQLLNNNEHQMQVFVENKAKFDKETGEPIISEEFLKDLDIFMETSTQSLVPKTLQLKNDAKGRTSYSEAYALEGKANLTTNAILNVLTRKGSEANQIYISGPNKGRRVGDVLASEYTLEQMKGVLETLEKSQWGPEAYTVDATNVKENNLILKKANESIRNAVGPKSHSRVNVKKAIRDLITIDKAIELGRSKYKKEKGMSTWDFDDTLAYTKSGVRYTLPNPSGKPQPKRKVIFMAGGAGSGKSNVIKQLGLEKQGFKIVNQDISLEWLVKNSGLPKDMRDFTPEQASKWGSLQWEARDIAQRKQTKFQGKGDGIIVDGTGASSVSMSAQVRKFKEAGYDVQMMFVETSLDVALARNKARKERSLKDFIVERNHKAVMENKKGFQELFGERFAEVNTDNLKQGDPMPSDLVGKLDSFTKGYVKGRLNAGEFASKGSLLKEQGAEFDFSEFNIVTEGAQGPFFKKALNRAKKFGTKDTYVLTARPPAAQVAIHEFLKSQGLNIPLKNITGLGNSTGEAKAMWMLEKFAEGYNDMYFADDAMQNVKAVKDVLDQLDIKSKVQIAKTGYEKVDSKTLKEKSLNEVKDVDKLDSPDNYKNVQFSKVHRAEYEKTISKLRLDLVKEGLVSKTIDNMFTFVDNLNIPDGKKRKYERITTKWLATSNIKLREDGYKVKDAVELAEKYKEDIFSYTNPNQIIEKYAGKTKAKPTDPNTVKEFAKGTVTNKKHGITEHVVENTKEGQLAVRKVMDTHFGENSNPWCLAQKKDGKLTEGSRKTWEHYSDGPKSMVFQNGKLIGFKANGQYWDRMDNATDAPVIRIKEGRVTRTVELVPIGGGKVQEFVMETRTTSKDKKTVTTEYHVERSLDAEGYYFHPEGTKVVENKVNGITVKEKIYRANGKIKRITDFKNGKEIETRTIGPDGKTNSINNGRELNWEKQGDLVALEIIDGNTNVWFGKALVNEKITEIGFKTPRELELMDVMKRVDGKLRVDFDKLRKVDPDIKGLPRDNRMFSKVDLSRDFNKILEEVKGVESFKKFSEGKAKEIGRRKGVWKWWGSTGMEDFQGLVTYSFAGRGKKGEAHKKFFEDKLQKPYNRAYNEIHSTKQTMSNDYSVLRKSMPEVTKQLRDKVGEGVYTVENAIRTYLWNKAGYEIPGMSKRDVKLLDNFVKNNEQLIAFAEGVSKITKLPEGYAKPKDYWLAETITGDLQKLADNHYRDLFLTEFKENREAIFGTWEGGKLVGENMNKIEAIYGSRHREHIESMLWAMETGQNRPYGTDGITNSWMNWINRSGGAIMFWNVKSAALQTISSINYMNGTFNNPFRAAQAFANQPQYWKDFAKIFNSDMLLQRRSGLKINIEANELISALSGKSNKAERALAYLLEKGFIPTKYADSFAIASGGATFYRNKIRSLMKQGMSKAQAEKQAWIEFTEITEATQQSSRPDFISAQQRSAIGRPILMFANTPMQMFRRHKRRIQDIVNRRGNTAENLMSAVYYGIAQTAIFSFLANAMFAKDEDDLEKVESGFNEKKDARFYETIIDSYMRGMGTLGAVPSAIKNAVIEFQTQNKKGYNADYDEVIYDLLSVSPPIGSKIRKIRRGVLKDWEYNKDVIPKIGFHIDNPLLSMSANALSAVFNIPADRLLQKINNLRDASNSDYETWQRIALATGINRWSLGLGKREVVIEAKEEVKEEKKIISKEKAKVKKEIREKKKEEEEKKVIEDNIKKQEQEKKDGKKDIKCAAVSRSGKRCKTTIKPGQSYCTIHEKVDQNKSGKKTRCIKMKQVSKKKKERCGMMTSSKSGYCYYHD